MRVTVTGPAWAVLIGTLPLGSVPSPDSPSEATTVAVTPFSPTTAVAGHFISSAGGVASTCTARVPGEDTLPALSATVPLAVCVPLVSNVWGALSDAGLVPLPALPSASAGSPLAANDTVTPSLYQLPFPAKSGGRVASARGAFGAVLSTTTGVESGEYWLVRPIGGSDAWTR